MGYIFDIQRFCVHDGPGIRTVVFLKGCPLRCKWCHNPEGLESYPQILYNFEKCISCGLCASVCKNSCHVISDGIHIYDISKCTSCMECSKNVCPAEALKAAGYERSTESIIKDVLADRNFFDESGGGMTLSGGEPFFQPEFALDLLRAAKKEGINTAVETSGATSSKVIEEAAKYVDLFLFDYKITGEDAHKKYTGVSQVPISENLAKLNALSANIILRCPVIPGINTNTEHYEAIGELTKRFKNIKKVNIMPYHAIGVSKYEKIGKKSPFSAQTMNYADANDIGNQIRKFSTVDVEII